MGSERNLCQFGRRRTTGACTRFLVPLVLAGCLAGCGDGVRRPTAEQMAAFTQASSPEPTVDLGRIEKARLCSGPYRVISGDVLEFTMSGLLRADRAGEVLAAQTPSRDERPYLCRVSTRGTVTLPAIGPVEVRRLSLAEIEEKATEAYRSYTVAPPSIFIRVTEYRTSKVYIAGAVEKPGVYALRADQMTLVSLLTEAGGISKSGAAVVRITRARDPNTAPAGPASANDSSPGPDATPVPILLPVVGRSIPFCDVALEEGDDVVVEQGRPPLFSVLGLVTKPGNFDYPPRVEYNLAQAIAFAGGLDPHADPHYATIYRRNGDGTIARIPFELIRRSKFTEALATPIQPGDLVAIEHTLRTRANMTIHDLIRFNFGVYLTGRDFWD